MLAQFCQSLLFSLATLKHGKANAWKDFLMLFPEEIFLEVSLGILYNGAVNSKGNTSITSTFQQNDDLFVETARKVVLELLIRNFPAKSLEVVSKLLKEDGSLFIQSTCLKCKNELSQRTTNAKFRLKKFRGSFRGYPDFGRYCETDCKRVKEQVSSKKKELA